MSYVAKHAAARKPNVAVRMVGALAVAGAAVAGGITSGSSSAAAATPAAAKGNVWDRVAACESGGNWSISTGNGYYGGLQFSASSWRAAGGTKYASMPHHATKGQQIATAQNLLRLQGPGAWPVCSRKAGLTKANGLSSGGGAAAVTKAPAKKATTSTRAVAGNRNVGLNNMDTRRLHTYLGLERKPSMSVNSVKALQRKVGVKADGIIGPQTVRGLERHIGAKRTGASYVTKGTANVLSKFVKANS